LKTSARVKDKPLVNKIAKSPENWNRNVTLIRQYRVLFCCEGLKQYESESILPWSVYKRSLYLRNDVHLIVRKKET
jgi:hypothetical protein